MSEYIELRDAIELCGPRVIAGWSENGFKTERHAPTRGELIAERTKILELPAETILADAKATHRNRMKRLTQERDLAYQPLTSIDDALGKLRAELADLQAEVASTKNKEERTTMLRKLAAREKTLARLEKSRTARPIGRSKDDLVNEHRHYLLEELEELQATAFAARTRWDTMHDRVRRAVAEGALRAYARLPLDGSPLGIITPLAAELFPEPGQQRVDIPFGANGELFPAEVVFVRADLEQIFPATPKETGGSDLEERVRETAKKYIDDCKGTNTVPKLTSSKGDDCFKTRCQNAPSAIVAKIWKEIKDAGMVKGGGGRRPNQAPVNF